MLRESPTTGCKYCIKVKKLRHRLSASNRLNKDIVCFQVENNSFSYFLQGLATTPQLSSKTSKCLQNNLTLLSQRKGEGERETIQQNCEN